MKNNYLMSGEFYCNIIEYGYLAILVLIFLQEVGFPSPVPNEFVLLFSGYMSFMGYLSLPIAILAAAGGDLLAGFVLYIVFRYFGKFILQHKPKWIPISNYKINEISQKVDSKGIAFVFFGRLTPLVRGYIAVISGLLQISFNKFGFIIGISSSLWASFYITVGYFFGPFWESNIKQYFPENWGLISISIFIVIIFIITLTKRIPISNIFKIKQLNNESSRSI